MKNNINKRMQSKKGKIKHKRAKQKIIDSKKMGRSLMMQRGSRTQQEVAEAVNVSPSAIRNYEAGDRIPQDPIKINIAMYYQKTVQELFFATALLTDQEPDEEPEMTDLRQGECNGN